MDEERKALFSTAPVIAWQRRFFNGLRQRLKQAGFQMYDGIRLRESPALFLAVRSRKVLFVLEVPAGQQNRETVEPLFHALNDQLPAVIKSKRNLTSGICTVTTHVRVKEDCCSCRFQTDRGFALQVTFEESTGRFYMFHTMTRQPQERRVQKFLYQFVLGYPGGRLPASARSAESGVHAVRAQRALEEFNAKERKETYRQWREEQDKVFNSMEVCTAKVYENDMGEFVFVRLRGGGVWYMLERDSLYPDCLIVCVNQNFYWNYSPLETKKGNF